MKKNVRYECELCRNEYETEEEALRCEAKHTRPVKVKAVWWGTHGLPEYIDVEYDNGETGHYKYEKKLSSSETPLRAAYVG